MLPGNIIQPSTGTSRGNISLFDQISLSSPNLTLSRKVDASDFLPTFPGDPSDVSCSLIIVVFFDPLGDGLTLESTMRTSCTTKPKQAELGSNYSELSSFVRSRHRSDQRLRAERDGL